MEIISLQQAYTNPIVLCLGFFDSMHKGHIKLLRAAQQMAQGRAKVALFTFDNNHFETLFRPTKLLFTFDERLTIYQSLGVDVVVFARFDRQFMNLSGEEFLSRIARFNLVGVVCGSDFTCGSDTLSAQKVQQILQDKTQVSIVELLKRGEEKICSSLVRSLLLHNKTEEANSLLSQPFFFLGRVVSGRHIGSDLGFPTVNLQIPPDKIVPCGVYVGKVDCTEGCFDAVVNVGAKPTFDCTENSVEAHLVGFDGDLYGQTVKISLLRYIRPIQRFSSAEELKKQLTKDLGEI